MSDPDTTLNSSTGVPPYQSPKSPQFPPLSEQPVDPCVRMQTDNPIDKMPLEKSSPRADPEEKIEKDLKPLIPDTMDRITFAINQGKHQKFVQTELKVILEHEKKILTQISDRASKFTAMKEENKKKIDEWEAEHNQRIPFYTQYLKELMEIPENECLTQEGVPTAVGQKILYNIVENTSHIANNAIVQLSMQNTLVNDIDLSLAKVRQFCAVMLKNIDSWLRMINTQSDNQQRILDLWEHLKQRVKDMKEMTEDDDDGSVGGVPKAKIKSLEDRVTRLESTVDVIQGAPSPPGGGPPSGPSSLKPGSPHQQPARPPNCPPCPPQQQPARPPNCPPCPPQQQQFPTGADYFGPTYNDRTPPDPNTLNLTVGTNALRDAEGKIVRRRASPNCPRRMEMVDVFGGTPFPREAMELTSVRRQQPPIPLPQSSPVPPKQGRFMPVSASSPQGTLRSPWEYGKQADCPQMDQPMDPALLPKIQEDLENLSKKNKKLEKLVNDFREMRKLLTDEMDKAVRLNQKLQRDLYFVAQEANKPS